jgi:hypothetical protein
VTGASAPDILVQNVISRLQELGGGEAVPLEAKRTLFSKSRKNCVSMPAKSNNPFLMKGQHLLCWPFFTRYFIVTTKSCLLLIFKSVSR